MAYELFVRGVRTVPIDVLESLAHDEPWYELLGDAGGALLTNTNTGVYMNFAPSKMRDGFIYAVNVRAPQFFAVEALATLNRLCERHAWRVDGDAGIDAWKAAHDSAGHDPRAVRISSDCAQAVWRWNYELPAMRMRLERHAVIAPKIFFTTADGATARTMLQWTHGTHRLALPQTDEIVFRSQHDEPQALLDRETLLKEAAYFCRTESNVTVIDAPRFSVLQAAIERSRREQFTGQIVASDMLVEEGS